MNNVVPFPASRIQRLFSMRRLAGYHGLMVQVFADEGPYALICYDGAPHHKAWVLKSSLAEWEEAYSGRPADTEEERA